MHGAKGDRHLLLFEKGLLIAKHKDDAGLQIKDCIKVSASSRSSAVNTWHAFLGSAHLHRVPSVSVVSRPVK